MEFNFNARRSASEEALLRVAEAADQANAELEERIKVLSYRVDSAWLIIKMQSECIDALSYKTNAYGKEFMSVVEATIPQKYRKAFSLNIQQKAQKIGKLYSDVTEEIYAEYSKKLDDLKREYGMDSDKK